MPSFAEIRFHFGTCLVETDLSARETGMLAARKQMLMKDFLFQISEAIENGSGRLRPC